MAGYTEHEAEIVTKGWLEESLSASQIAAKLPGRTRSSVIGFVHRHIGACTRKSGRTKKPVYFASQRPARAKFALPPAPEPLPEIAESFTIGVRDRVKLVDLQPHQCRWPLGGDPRTDEDFGYCGYPQFKGIPGTDYGRSSYCLEHHRRAINALWRPGFEKALAKMGRSP
jgi:hypothetical protein